MSEACANCGAAIKTGLLGSNFQLREDDIAFINLAHGLDLADGCEKCSRPLLDTAPHKISEQLKAKRKSAEALLSCLPLADLFGAQSGAYNQKLRNAEESCRSSLRAQTFQLGGNAVVGVDVDYAEVGGARAMLMVCMTGTAINVDEPSMLGAGFAEKLEQLRLETISVRELTAIARKRGLQ